MVMDWVSWGQTMGFIVAGGGTVTFILRALLGGKMRKPCIDEFKRQSKKIEDHDSRIITLERVTEKVETHEKRIGTLEDDTSEYRTCQKLIQSDLSHLTTTTSQIKEAMEMGIRELRSEMKGELNSIKGDIKQAMALVEKRRG